MLMSTTYGYGEKMCGDPGHARACDSHAVTASGIKLDPELPQAAIAAPANMVLKARIIGLRAPGGPCVRVHLVDKMNEKWIGVRGFDLTPGALKLITGKPPTKHWTGRVSVCALKE